MARVQSAIASFISGEVTPALLGRTDTDQYPQFLGTAENVFVEKHGGVKRRGGSLMVNAARTSKVRLVPFIFSRTDSYVMEFGDYYVRFFQDDGYIENPGSIVSYLGDGETKQFQYPFGLQEEQTQGNNSQTVFPYSFDVGVDDTFEVWLFDSGVWTLQDDPADYSWQEIAKTITMVVAPASNQIVMIAAASITEDDIEVYLSDDGKIDYDNPVDPGLYTVQPINTIENILSPFAAPEWNPDATDIGTPWTFPAADTAASPVGAEPVLREEGIHIAHGAIVDMGVALTAVDYTETNYTNQTFADNPLPTVFAQILSLTVINDNNQSVDAGFTIEDASAGSHTSDFYWNLLHGQEVIASGSALAISAATPITIPSVPLDDPKNGDIISLEVRADPNNANSEPIVAGQTNPTYITNTYEINSSAKIHVQSRDSGQGSFTLPLDPRNLTLPYVWKIADDVQVDDPQPLLIEFFTDVGLEITLADVYARNSRAGWVITMDQAPAVGQTLIILDKNFEGSPTPIEGGPPFEIQSPFAVGELDQLYWSQANDVMLFCHYAHKPWRLTRYGPYEWVWDQPTMYGAPWDVPATTHSAKGSDATDEPLIKQFPFYFSADSKDTMEVLYNNVVQPATNWDLKSGQEFPIVGQGDIITTNTPALGTVVTIALKVSDYNPAYGYPRCVVFFQERLWFGGTLISPQTVWGSRTADFFNFYTPNTSQGQFLSPDAAVEYTLAAYTHEAIEWFSSERVLVIGTSSTEHRLAPDEYVATDRLPQVSKMTDFGGGHQMPMYMGGLTCFIQQSGRQLRSFEQRSNMVLEEYQSTDLTWMASHMVQNMWIKEPYYALIPNNIAVMIREDGQLLTAMYDSSAGQTDPNEVAWSRQITDGKYQSCCVIPTDFGNEIWVSVVRNISGVDRTFIEVFKEQFFMDSAKIQQTEVETNIVTGLGYIEGKQVDVTIDGAVHPKVYVINGEVTLQWAGLEIVVGLPFIPKIVTVPFTDGNPGGTGEGKPGRWTEIWVRMVASAIPLVNGRRAPVRHPSTPMGLPEPVMTGAVRVYNTGYSYDKEITITQDLPLPMQITTLYGTFTLGTG